MTFRPGALLLIFAALAGACQSAPEPSSPSDPDATQFAPMAEADANTRATNDAKPLAYVDGRPVTREVMFGPLIEAAGGRVLTEMVLNRAIADQLDTRGVSLTKADLRRERQRVLRSMGAENEDQDARVLRELRQQRGLGDERFHSLLRRNAGLRALIGDQVQITEQSLRQAYRRQYGVRYRVRVLTVDRFDEASRLRGQIVAGEGRFADLAAMHSTDTSADRGGLLAPISPADPSYPESIRNAIKTLADAGADTNAAATQPAAARLSDVIALDDGFALLQVEEKIAPEPVEFADVKTELRRTVRLAVEQRLMRQLARRLLSDAGVVVLDRALGESWRRERDVLLSP